MKRNMSFTLRVLVIGLLVVSAGWGAFSKVGTTGAAFLKSGVGRGPGMGDAFGAIAEDASACWVSAGRPARSR